MITNDGIKDAAWIFGLCVMLSQCTNQSQTIKLDIDKDKITPAYCAGLKTGEAFREAFK